MLASGPSYLSPTVEPDRAADEERLLSHSSEGRTSWNDILGYNLEEVGVVEIQRSRVEVKEVLLLAR